MRPSYRIASRMANIGMGEPAHRRRRAVTQVGSGQALGASAVVSIEELPTAEARLARVRELTGGLGADVVFELSGAPYAFAEGLDFLRPGGRYAVVGQLGGPLTPVQAALFVRKQATILGVQSADIGQFWKALEFVRRTASRYDFEAMLTTRYPLDRINDAIQNMRAFREIKPLVLPWAS